MFTSFQVNTIHNSSILLYAEIQHKQDYNLEYSTYQYQLPLTAAADNRITLCKEYISPLEAGKSQRKYPKHSSLINY